MITISLLHIHIKSLHKNIDKLKILLNSINYKFYFIALSETWLKSLSHSYYFLPGYELIVNNKHAKRLVVESLSMFLVN